MAGEGGHNMLIIPKFDGDYEYWSMLMENLLCSKEWWHLVETGYAEPGRGEILNGPQRAELADLKLKDLKVKNYLFQAIDKTTLKTITEKGTSKQLWDSMKMRFQGDARIRNAQLQALRREFEILEMKNGESISDYFSRVVLVCNNMGNLREVMVDARIVEKVLRTLPESWNFVVCSIEESKDITTLSLNQLRSSLLVHEQKFQKGFSGEEQVLKVEGGRGRGVRKSFRGRGRGRGRGRSSLNKDTLECYCCHQLGHFQYECPILEKRANYAELEGEDEMLLMAYVSEIGEQKEDIWFLDSGCSNHMCSKKNMFCELNDDFKTTVQLGNNTRMQVFGKGSIRMEVDGLTCVVNDVYFIPELRNNLLSIGQLQEKGLNILIGSGRCKIYHPTKGLIIQTEITANRMFILVSKRLSFFDQAREEICFSTETQDLTQLWHRRLGHISNTTLQALQRNNLVHGLPKLIISKEVCVDCLKGKQHREPIPKRSLWRATQRLPMFSIFHPGSSSL